MEGGNFIWRIDPSRAANIKEFYIEKFGEEQGKILQERTTVLYLGVSRLRTIFDRSVSRSKNEGSEFNKTEFKQRLRQDWADWNQYKDKFENVVFNDGPIVDTVKQAKEIIFSATPNNS